ADHIDAGQGGDLIAVGIAALAVDRLDRAGGEPELLRHFGQPQAGGTLVLDLVVAGGKIAPRLLGRDRLFDLRGDLRERFDVLRLNLHNVNQHRAEHAFYRRAGLAFLHSERRVGNRLVDNAGLGHDAEVDIFLAQPALLR